ncbi:MAG: restriction endonuclease subunit S [Eudoraea sp.]|uniref:restriction endonuclease subunit S n=1 Tax=Eudoraea sp. TaxID=1979955 RepID=UPI0032633108
MSERIPVSLLIDNNQLYIGDGYRAKNSELDLEGFPFARAGNLNNGFQFEDADCIPYDDVKKVGVKKSRVGDVAFTSKGTIGRFGFVKSNTQKFVYSPQICFWRSLDQNILDSTYLYYWMNSYLFLNQVAMVSGQTDMALYVNLRDQRKMSIDLPDLSTQNKIASILSTYDDLIENNNQRIKLLEGMAEEIYKEWFVRFRFPGYIKTTFFDKDGSKVPHGTKDAVPEGWDKKSIKEIVDNIKEKYNEKEHSNLGIFDLSRMPRKSLSIPEFGASDELESSRIIFEENDILFGSIRSYFHKVSSANKKGITNVSVLVFRVKKEIYRSYALFTFFNTHFIKWSINFSNGTKMPTISWNEVQNYSINKPPEDLLESFEEKVFPMVKEIHLLSDKNQVLQDTRDLLLPPLISGKLSVEEIDNLNMATEHKQNTNQ